MIHQLKTQSNYFDDVVSGKKTFEVRKNDRDFHVGDFLALNELTNQPCEMGDKTSFRETGRCCLVSVRYILTDPAFVKDGYVILGFAPCFIGCASGGELSFKTFDSRHRVPVYLESYPPREEICG